RQQEDQRDDDRVQRIAAEEQWRQTGGCRQCRAERQPQITSGRREGEIGGRHRLSSNNQNRACAEKSPWGRHISTSIKVAKPTVSRNARPTRVATRLSAIPRIIAAKNVPRTLPSPPMMITGKVLKVMISPIP